MKALSLLFAVLLIVGCGGQPAQTQTSNATPSFAKDIQPILTQTCMPCHAGGTAAKGKYDVTGYAGVMGNGLDSIPNVIPGHADSSTLYRRLNDTLPPRMPKFRAALNATQLSTIQKWINQGAKNN